MHNKRGAADFTTQTQTQTGRNGPFIVAHFRNHEQRDVARGMARCCNEARPLKSRARANTRRTPPNAPPARLRWEHPPKCRPAARIEPSRDLTTMICARSVRGKTVWRASIRIGRCGFEARHRQVNEGSNNKLRRKRCIERCTDANVCFDYALFAFSKKALSKLRKESRPRAASLQCSISQGAGTQHPVHFSCAPARSNTITANSEASATKKNSTATAARSATCAPSPPSS